MYEDSIQELNNLIGELDSFQREHELKIRQEEEERKKQLNSSSTSRLTDFNSTMSLTTPMEIVEAFNNFDKLSICSVEPTVATTNAPTNATNISSPSLHSSDLTFSSSDAGNTTAHTSFNGNVSHDVGDKRTASTPTSNENGVACNIQLIQEEYNVPDSYLKQHTEIVVLRRKDSSASDVNASPNDDDCRSGNGNGSVSNGCSNGSKRSLERVSSFRCTSFSKPDFASVKSPTTNGHSANNDESVISQNEIFNSPTKPNITPRPASLSGLFLSSFLFHFLSFLFLVSSRRKIIAQITTFQTHSDLFSLDFFHRLLHCIYRRFSRIFFILALDRFFFIQS